MELECKLPVILRDKVSKNELVRIQTQSHSVYEGVISEMDCLGILFIPTDKSFSPAYILYPDIKKVILPEHK